MHLLTSHDVCSTAHCGIRQTWVSIAAPPFTSCVISGKLLNVSSLLRKGGLPHQDVVRIKSVYLAESHHLKQLEVALTIIGLSNHSSERKSGHFSKTN